MKFKLLTLIMTLFCTVAFADVSLFPINITEEDGTPSKYPRKIKFANGTLTDNGDGTISHTQAGGAGGDNVTVNGTAADTTANFTDGDIDFTLVDGGAGGPDGITATVACTGCVDDADVDNNITIDLATLATTVTVTDDEATNDAHEVVFTTDNANLESDGTTTYNPSTGVITATGFAGALTGNSSTASALAANGGNCNAGEYALGVDASGAIESCTDATTEINTEIGNVLDGTDAFTDFNGAVIDSDNIVTNAVKLDELDVSDISDNIAGDIAEGELADNIIVSADIKADVITHADILDSDQTVTMCIYFEDPVATDDFNSIWANKTANDFLITEIWGESDQTVSFDLQVDDGGPADVSQTDIAPAAGEAEDTSLDGDTTVAADEELDLAITSVTNTPTWVSICWTGNWVD